MTEFLGAPWWVWLAGAIVALAMLGVGGFFAWRFLWHRFSRRYLVALIGRRENVLASRRTLEAVIRHLADEPIEALLEFAGDPESVDRKALHEVTQRMALLSDDLWTMPLPSRLHPVGEALGDAAASISEEAGRVGELMGTDDVLEALQKIDLARVQQDSDRAESLVEEACEYYDVQEAAIYGGGLYI